MLLAGSEIILIHDWLLTEEPGLAGCPDTGKADAVAERVANALAYGTIQDTPHQVAAMTLIAIARGHVFNDGNKRTAFTAAVLLLDNAGLSLRADYAELEDMVVNAATGALTVEEVAATLQHYAR